MTMQPVPAPPATGAPSVAQAPVNQQGNQGQIVPFRIATVERTQTMLVVAKAMTTSEQQDLQEIVGSGYIYCLDLFVQAPASSNTAIVVKQEDAPYCALSLIAFQDVNGQTVNLTSGFNLKLINLYCGYESPADVDGTSNDALVYEPLVEGNSGDGGSFAFHLRLPIGLNRRDLVGILGNQNQAQSYELRSNFAASGTIYSTSPTTLPTVTKTITYESYTVPNPYNPDGSANQLGPNTYGVLHYLLDARSQAVPASGIVQHYLQRKGNTLRVIILVARCNGSRQNAEAVILANPTNNITMKIGDQPLFNETFAERRRLMRQRYGFDAPAGVFVYDAIHDWEQFAGYELGNDYWFSRDVVTWEFDINWPSAIGSTNNSLTFVTDDLQIPNTVNIYNP